MLLPPEKRQEAVETLRKMIDMLGLDAEVTDASQGDHNLLNVKTEKPGRLIGRKGLYLSSLELLLNRIVQKRVEEYVPIHIDVDGYQRGVRDRADETEGAAPAAGAPVERRREPREPRSDRGERREPRNDRGGDRGERRDPRERRNDRGPRNDGDDRGDRHERRGAATHSPEEIGKMAVDVAKEVRLWGQPKALGPYNSMERRCIHEALQEMTGIEGVSGPDVGGNRKTITIQVAGAAPRSDTGAGTTGGQE